MWWSKKKKMKKIALARFCGKINHAVLAEGGQLSAGPVFNVTAYDELTKDHIELTSLNRGPFRNSLTDLANFIKDNGKRIVIEVKEEDDE
jgi:hypothetical protein